LAQAILAQAISALATHPVNTPGMQLAAKVLLYAILPSAFAQVLEIHFEPLELNAGPPRELMDMFSESRPDDIGQLFGMLFNDGRAPLAGLRQRRRGGFMEGGLFTNDPFSLPVDWALPILQGERSTMQVSKFHDLFPGPMHADMDAPDRLVDNMMQHISKRFKDEVLPTLRHSRGANMKAWQDKACQKETQRLCDGASSQLRCLGQNAGNISAGCRKNVGKSVPFLCASELEKYCDVLERGILPCLADHLSNLQDSCRDAVLATHQVIAKVNTQKATLVDPKQGEKKTYTPLLPPPAASHFMEEPKKELDIKFASRAEPPKFDNDDNRALDAPALAFTKRDEETLAGAVAVPQGEKASGRDVAGNWTHAFSFIAVVIVMIGACLFTGTWARRPFHSKQMASLLNSESAEATNHML